ncbi:hypothetical protein CEXT_326131 [Caerostris extrusa]|uniref:Uncharacterized protein n=1 Tax=Caerostris extrusa TaxID=172846 RepID=A0AAV4PI90_CAEEX|nr:hypothetical protein CEXT_326131 [Caerostris extrusa]
MHLKPFLSFPIYGCIYSKGVTSPFIYISFKSPQSPTFIINQHYQFRLPFLEAIILHCQNVPNRATSIPQRKAVATTTSQTNYQKYVEANIRNLSEL